MKIQFLCNRGTYLTEYGKLLNTFISSKISYFKIPPNRKWFVKPTKTRKLTNVILKPEYIPLQGKYWKCRKFLHPRVSKDIWVFLPEKHARVKKKNEMLDRNGSSGNERLGSRLSWRDGRIWIRRKLYESFFYPGSVISPG